MEQIYPGIWKITLGEPEVVTPVALRHISPAAERLAALPASACPFAPEGIRGVATPRGYQVMLDLETAEQLFGLGLQLLSFNQRGKKKTLRVNSDPTADLGDSHAPVPFYVSTRGYGVLVDTARYATFYLGSEQRLRNRAEEGAQAQAREIARSTEELYAARDADHTQQVVVEIPHAAGVVIYLFAGPEMREAVQRYNLFSGGGCLPPRWGLGFWYRCRGDFNDAEVREMAETLRAEEIPCDVLGLEPGWQSHSYSCSFLWDKKFPDPARMLADLAREQYHVNLWTHVFVHASSPLYAPLFPYAGDYEVWEGLVPDLTLPAARAAMADFFLREHVAPGVAGYKLDECDNSDFIPSPWSFPEISRFPSGIDGEQLHCLLGSSFQAMVESIFRARNQRAYHEVRSAHALAAPYPFVLYSDLYKHQDFIRGVVNCGFSGLLWCPEVRDAASEEDLIRRLQSVVFSPQALVNAWYIKHAPWKQWRTEENNADHLLDHWQELEGVCRDLLRLRMSLVPYLYAAFFRYYEEGLPPFRALVMDYPQEENLWKTDDQYLVGDNLLVAPLVAGMTERSVTLPPGRWHDFYTGQAYEGGTTLIVAPPLTTIPVFVKSGTLLPLAQPTPHTADPASFNLTVRIYGDGSLPATLIEDDGGYAYQSGAINRVTLRWDAATHTGAVTRTGQTECPEYHVVAWEQMGE